MVVKTIKIVNKDTMSFTAAVSLLEYKKNIMRRKSLKEYGISDYLYLGRREDLIFTGDELDLITKEDYLAKDWIIEENKNI